MEEAQFSEELFTTQDGDAALQQAESASEVIPTTCTDESIARLPSDSEKNGVDGNTSLEKETPDLVFSEDIDFGKPSEDAAIQEPTETTEKPGEEPKDPPEARLAVFPFARIKQVMKLDPDVGILSAEAIFLVTKAAELFLQNLAKDASTHTLTSKKKTMSKKDVEMAVDNADSLMFLEGMMNVQSRE